MSRPWAAASLCALLLLGSTGCGRVREISACRGLSREVNPVLKELSSMAQKPGGGDPLQLAARYAKLAKRVKERAHGSDPLSLSMREYADMLDATSAALQAHALALGQNQPARVAETRRDLDRLLKRERALVIRIDVECQS